jgi:hypothetical protein
MPLLLVHPSVDLTLELYVSSALEEAIALQWERVRTRTVRDTYVKALECRLEDLLRDCLDWDLKPPTAAQVSYATLLAARHGLSVPSEALNYRFHMAMFIEAWARKPPRTGNEGVKPEPGSSQFEPSAVVDVPNASSAEPDPPRTS